MADLPVALTDRLMRETARGLAEAIVTMHRDEAANAACARAGLDHVAARYNPARIDALMREVARPALDRFAARRRAGASPRAVGGAGWMTSRESQTGVTILDFFGDEAADRSASSDRLGSTPSSPVAEAPMRRAGRA
jgi:hypothetical protein